jgi:hypothetical protein
MAYSIFYTVFFTPETFTTVFRNLAFLFFMQQQDGVTALGMAGCAGTTLQRTRCTFPPAPHSSRSPRSRPLAVSTPNGVVSSFRAQLVGLKCAQRGI